MLFFGKNSYKFILATNRLFVKIEDSDFKTKGQGYGSEFIYSGRI